MPCYSPLLAHWGLNDKGHLAPQFSSDVYRDLPMIELPCGKCIGCRLEYSRQWAMRCVHEASLYDRNCFITLTYNDEHLPIDLSLDYKHFQLFMKRLRKKFGPKIRFFACGEYGDKNYRPHFHACLFNFDFDDKVVFKSGSNPLYVSPSLDSLWSDSNGLIGFSTIGQVTFDSASYVARYVTKKVTGDLAIEHYTRVGLDGKTYQVVPEFARMSRRPGIGAGYYEKYKDDFYSDDSIIVNGRSVKPPRFYDSRYSVDNQQAFSCIREKRRYNNFNSSLLTRERAGKIAEARASIFQTKKL